MVDAQGAMQAGLQQLIGPLYPYIATLVALGALSMALIQTAKDLIPLRRYFQRSWLKSWLKKRCESAPALDTGGKPNPQSAEADLIKLATSNDGNALYDLPIEQMCGQMNAALQSAMDNPRSHKDLIWCFGGLADSADLKAILEPPAVALLKKAEVRTAEENKSINDFATIRNRVAHYIQRAVDGVQISVGFQWKWRLRFTAVILSAIVAYLGLWKYYTSNGLAFNVPAAVGTGILAGFIAPVARDLVAAIQQWRN